MRRNYNQIRKMILMILVSILKKNIQLGEFLQAKLTIQLISYFRRFFYDLPEFFLRYFDPLWIYDKIEE